jgi:hypothetical protein
MTLQPTLVGKEWKMALNMEILVTFQQQVNHI